MLRHLILMSTSGIVLFSKEFDAKVTRKANILGSLLTTMRAFALKTTTFPVSYIELSNIAVSMVSEENSKICCVLLHDTKDGPKFGEIVGAEVLGAFLQNYEGAINHPASQNLKIFRGFQFRLVQILEGSMKPILAHLQQRRGIRKAMILKGDTVVHSTVEIDHFGVLANLGSMMHIASDIMAAVGDSSRYVLCNENRSKVVVRRINPLTLIVVFRSGNDSTSCFEAVEDTVTLLKPVCHLVSNLHQSSR